MHACYPRLNEVKQTSAVYGLCLNPDSNIPTENQENLSIARYSMIREKKSIFFFFSSAISRPKLFEENIHVILEMHIEVLGVK